MSAIGPTLRLACIDSDAMPLFGLADENGVRPGYEPEAAALVADHLGAEVRWVFLPWSEMIPAARSGEVHGVWCGQGITPTRQVQVDFTRPYAVFDESVLVRRGAGVSRPEDLAGRRVAAIAESANLALAQTFPGVEVVAFDGGSADVFGDMLAALRDERVDAVVDDDVALVPLADDPGLELAFTVPTRNRWAVGVGKDFPDVRDELDRALAGVVADGRLGQAWRRWMPDLAYPFAEQETVGSRG